MFERHSMTLTIKMKKSLPSHCCSLIDSHQYPAFSFYLVPILNRLGNILTFEGQRRRAFQADQKAPAKAHRHGGVGDGRVTQSVWRCDVIF